jgi:hypothetical protein
MLRQGTQNISLDVSTLLLARGRFKRKPARLCAESVDASNSLWKALEKWKEFESKAVAREKGQIPLRDVA